MEELTTPPTLEDLKKMYDIPGQDPITGHSFERYTKDKEREDAQIAKLLLLSPKNMREMTEEERIHFLRQRLEESRTADILSKWAQAVIEHVQPENQLPLQEIVAQKIEEWWPKSDTKEQRMLMKMVSYVPKEKREGLIKRGLNTPNLSIQEEASDMIRVALEEASPLREIVYKKIEESFKSPSDEPREALISMLLDIPQRQRGRLVDIGLKSQNPEAQRVSAEMIRYLPDTEIASFVEKGLNSNSPEVQKISAYTIRNVSFEERSVLIRKGMESTNLDVQGISAKTIYHAPPKERTSLIKQGLKCSNPLAQKDSAENIHLIEDDTEMVALINNGLNCSSAEAQEVSANQIEYVPEEDRTLLINEGLKSSNPRVQRISAFMIGQNISERGALLLAEKEVSRIIKQNLEIANPKTMEQMALMISCTKGEDRKTLEEMLSQKLKEGIESLGTETQKALIPLVVYIPEREIAPLVEVGFNSPDVEVQKTSVSVIDNIEGAKRASFVKRGLESMDAEIQEASAHMIYCVPREEIPPLIMLGLKSSNPEVQKISALQITRARIADRAQLIMFGLENSGAKTELLSVIGLISEEHQLAMLAFLTKKKMGNNFVAPRLYKNNKITNKDFSRQKFAKTGSETVLIGGGLKDKTILRKIEPSAFVAWQSVYENHNLWTQAGFDYVPIEPIQSYHLNSEGLVDVYTGILDLSLSDWIDIDGKNTALFRGELEKQRDKIIEILEREGIRHGHIHDRNFCLRFYRDEQGEPDFARVPRIYLIDFDQAISPEKATIETKPNSD